MMGIVTLNASYGLRALGVAIERCTSKETIMCDIDWPSWVQAVGSIAAIVATVYAVDRQHRKAAAAERARAEAQARERMDRLQATIQQAQTLVGMLTDKDIGPRARAWSEKFNNDVSLALAQVDFILEQFRVVSLFDVPVGVNVVKSMNEAAFSLVAAKLALSRELDAPFTSETPSRVSDAIPLAARAWAGLALLRGHAVTKAQYEAAGSEKN